MKCSGIDIATGEQVEISFAEIIESVAPALEPAEDPPLLAPGFIDLQVNGFAGVDYNSPETPLEEIRRSIQALYATGVTRFFPTVITGSPEDMAGAMRNLALAQEHLQEGESIEGIHMEGPYISPEDGPRGAHPLHWVREPDAHEFIGLLDASRGLIRIVTVAPEWPEAPRLIDALTTTGIVASIGHTAADSDQIRAAVESGASMSTHLGNAAHDRLSRRSNYIWDQMAEDRLAAGFIVDGIHLNDAFLQLALRAKGLERSILVTDAVAPAGCPPGSYRIGAVEVELTEDGRVVLAGGSRLAGSSLSMERGIENLMRIAGLSLPEAVSMATRNPARVARVASRQLGLAAGDRGDIVQFRLDDGKIHIEKTFVSGREVYSAR